jgi:hypothetical protein
MLTGINSAWHSYSGITLLGANGGACLCAYCRRSRSCMRRYSLRRIIHAKAKSWIERER